jgi:hypothetical protein
MQKIHWRTQGGAINHQDLKSVSLWVDWINETIESNFSGTAKSIFLHWQWKKF